MSIFFLGDTLAAGLLDQLFIRQPEVILVLVIAVMAVGILFWLFGARFHRLVVTVLALSAGMVVGWYLGASHSVNPLLGMVLGAAVGAALGYWLFRVWLGLLASLLILLVLLGFYGSRFVIPRLQAAGQTSRSELGDQGSISLRPPTPPTDMVPTTNTTRGQAYRNLEELIPWLSPANYDTWDHWRPHFREVLSAVSKNLLFLMPHPKVDLVVILAVSLVAGVVLTIFKPTFLNIVYTSALGATLIVASAIALLTLKQSVQGQWLWDNAWTVWSALLLLTLVGSAVQYAFREQPVEEEGDPEDVEEDEKPAKAGKSKKK